MKLVGHKAVSNLPEKKARHEENQNEKMRQQKKDQNLTDEHHANEKNVLFQSTSYPWGRKGCT